MKPLFVNYSKCSTCQKAKKWLEENSIEFDSRHIVKTTLQKRNLKHGLLLVKSQLKNFSIQAESFTVK